jgi:sphingomyelin phosphodiesterase acid-like 3
MGRIMKTLKKPGHDSVYAWTIPAHCVSFLGRRGGVTLFGGLLLGACLPAAGSAKATPQSAPQVSSAPAPAASTKEAVVVPVSTGPASTAVKGTFMALSDIHFGKDADTQSYCGMTETDKGLWKAAQSKAKTLVSTRNPEFIIYTGDLPAHCDSQENRKREFGTTLDGLASIVDTTTIPILYMPGNNDSVGDDYCSFSSTDFTTGKTRTPLDYSNSPSDWPVFNGKANIISKDAVHGYYSVYPLGAPKAGETGLRVIALNTVIFTGGYAGCMGHTARQKAANDQMDWLAGQLTAAAASTPPEKVMIAMHVPAGVDGYTVPAPYTRHVDYKYNWSKDLSYTGNQISGAKGDWLQKVFLDLVANKQAEIVSILSGHTHLNGIRRVNDCAGNFTELNLSIPAITHDHGSNPAMKVISYDANFELLEDETYYAQNTNGAYEWGKDTSFKFSHYYTCPTGQSCTTLFDRVKAIGEAEGDYQLLHDMLSVLAVNPGHRPAGQRSYKEAMDTMCTPYPAPK